MAFSFTRPVTWLPGRIGNTELTADRLNAMQDGALEQVADALASAENGIIETTGPPTSGLGENRQYALDRTAGRLYGPKTAGAWDTSTWIALDGTPGAVGPPGPPAALIGTGPPPSDLEAGVLYFQTIDGTLVNVYLGT